MANRTALSVFCATALCVLSTPLIAADFYVSPGSSITNAMAAANPGDTVHVNAGTYNENVQINKPGTSSAYITLMANGAVTINAGGAGKALRIAASYIVVNGFECTNFLEGLNMRTAHIKVYNCNFHAGSSNTSTVSGSNGLTVNFDAAIDDIDIENSNFYFNDAGGADFGCNSTTDVLTNITLVNCKFYANNCLGGTDGIGIGHQGTKANITLLHCQAYDNLSDGFDLDAPVYMDGCIAHDNDRNGGPNWGVGMKAWGHTGNPPVYGQVRLYNCLSYNNTEETAGGGGINVGGANSIVSNCLVSGNTSYAGIILCSGSSVTIKNTIFYKEHYAISADSDTSGLTFDPSNVIFSCSSNGALSSTAAAQAKSFDPQFVSATDFHLKNTSPCIDAGVTVSGVTKDADNNPRPSGIGFDIGPYEFQSAVVPAPVITSPTSAGGTTGSAFSYTITASNSPTSFNATGLPAGLSVNTGTGVISGTPTSAGTSTVTISAKNSGGTGTATLTLTISAANVPPVITSAPFASPNPAMLGQSVNFTTAASDANSDTLTYVWNFGDGATASGASATHAYAAAGNFTASVTVTDGHGGTGSATLALTINAAPPQAPAISSATSASGTVGSAFTYVISASNSPTSFNATGLPTGLSVNTASGVISGTPTTAGTSSVSLSATNAGGTGSATLSLVINPATSPGKSLHVSNIAMKLAGTRSKSASATITIVDGSGTLISGANVTGTWSGLTTATVSTKTTTAGTIKFTSAKSTAAGTFTFTVTGVSLSGYTYASDQNAATRASITTSGVVSIAASPALTPTATAAASVPAGAIDLGTVKLNQRFKTKLTFPADFPTRGVHSTATSLPKGARISGLYVGGKATAAGTFTFTVQSKAKVSIIGADGERTSSTVQNSQDYVISVQP